MKEPLRLPASREQAKTLGVSRNSVLWALERLQSEGYVVARVGALASFGKTPTGLRPPVVEVAPI